MQEKEGSDGEENEADATRCVNLPYTFYRITRFPSGKFIVNILGRSLYPNGRREVTSYVQLRRIERPDRVWRSKSMRSYVLWSLKGNIQCSEAQTLPHQNRVIAKGRSICII
jgi:hypothetical protein